MSDDSGRVRRHPDTLALQAALVFPGDPETEMGPNVVRIPARVVWREGEAAPVPAAGNGRVVSSDAMVRHAGPADELAGHAESEADTVTAAAPRPMPGNGFSPLDPVASFLQINDALDRMNGGAVVEAPGAVPGGAATRGGNDIADPTAPVPVVDDRGTPINGARGPMMRPAGYPPEFFVKPGSR